MSSLKRPMELVFNGKRFAPRGLAAAFNGKIPQEIAGFYDGDWNGVYLFTRENELDAYVVSNSREGHFAVTAVMEANGKRRHMASTAPRTEAWLGLDGLSYAQSKEALRGMKFIDMRH